MVCDGAGVFLLGFQLLLCIPRQYYTVYPYVSITQGLCRIKYYVVDFGN